MKKNYKNKKGGFIALFSVVIISFVLILMATTLNFAGFYGRFNILDSEAKEKSNELADACLEVARLKIAQNDYTLDLTKVVNLDSDTCTYKISGTLPIKNILSTAEFQDAYSFYFAKVNTTNPKIPITEFSECMKLSPCP